MSLNNVKINNFNQHRKETQRQVSNSLSQLNSQADTAIKQQAYMHLNPDANGANDLIAVVNPEFFALAAQFNTIAEKLVDMQKVADPLDAMTAADMVTKYSLNLASYSESLI